ncbi:hypothetical protein AMATHDRAFT_72316 [Amanita thiersii Skay4041]|uniref:Sphingolipid long chain base-responsive protein LSP1 n=1 Tax=Amanita thiersii Skay4041 TaxID=703135 RepID=A0A2A9NY85_9AGAR|nr:hypothetical protein AMATHDRAFT_72316 [Amanita thiersii Skay4041]
MPVHGFLASFADKAQNVINSTPLAAHIPTSLSPRPPSSDPNAHSSGLRSHALESISHQLRSFGQQYSSSTSPAQKIITAYKGVAIDYDSVARDTKSQSKELYTWGQMELDDLKDVTDRLAYLNFVQGSLAGSLAMKLDAARAPLKAFRDAENALTPRRAIRAGLQNQLAKLEHDQQRGSEKRIAELKDQIRKTELEDETQERELEILKRKAVRESESAKWDAIREYGEKLVLLSKAATPIIAALPSIPPVTADSYTGAQATATARAALQCALDNYKKGDIELSPQPAVDLSRSGTCSFGESHANELSDISDLHPSIPTTPPPSHLMFPEPSHIPEAPPSGPPSLDQIPVSMPSTTPPLTEKRPSSTIPPVEPGHKSTSGSFADLKGATSVDKLDGDQSPLLSVSGSVKTQQDLSVTRTGKDPVENSSTEVKKHESAEEEKRRLEREEREKMLKAGSSDTQKKDEDELPPYQDI